MNRKSIIATSVFLAFTALPSQANIMFDFNYDENIVGVGFLDAINGDMRQQAMTDAGNLYSDLFGSYFSNSATLYIDVTSSEDPASSTLASAGSYLTSACENQGQCVVNEVIKTKLQTGDDINGEGKGAGSDGSVNVNWAEAWTVDPADDDANKFDFFAAIFHELTHALGFSSMINEDGTGIFDREWSTFDTFLQNANGDNILKSDFSLDATAWDSAKTGGEDNGIFFNGINAVEANGGESVGIYSPTSWESGSSGSHIDGYALPGDMMVYNRGFGPETRTFSAVDVGILTDIGYTRNAVTSVPEPGTLGLGLFGLLCGLFIRRRNNS